MPRLRHQVDVLSPPHDVAAVVPAWDEAATIGGVVEGLLVAGACCVFVVDAASQDGTARAAHAAGATVVEEPVPGYGRACQAGARRALGAGHGWVAFLDGDGSCDPADLSSLVSAAGRFDADVVLGSRRRPGRGAIPWHAAAGNRLVTTLLRVRTGRRVSDLPPFKLVRADVLRALDLDDSGFGWTAQLVGRCLSHPALRVVEVPTAFAPRAGGASKVSGRLGASMRAGRAMLSQAWRSSRGRGLLVLMAKAPRAGHSKTRLAAGVGTAAALDFWTSCLEVAGERLRAAAAEAGLDVAAMTPSSSDATAVRRLTGLPTLVQSRPGLGPALLEVSGLRAPFTIAVSADVPRLPAAVLVEAARCLGEHPAVLGPSADGGYYLVGLRRGFDLRRRRTAFLDTALGEAGVLEHTLAALGGAHLLETWTDIDTRDDLADWPEVAVHGAR